MVQSSWTFSRATPMQYDQAVCSSMPPAASYLSRMSMLLRHSSLRIPTSLATTLLQSCSAWTCIYRQRATPCSATRCIIRLMDCSSRECDVAHSALSRHRDWECVTLRSGNDFNAMHARDARCDIDEKNVRACIQRANVRLHNSPTLEINNRHHNVR